MSVISREPLLVPIRRSLVDRLLSGEFATEDRFGDERADLLGRDEEQAVGRLMAELA